MRIQSGLWSLIIVVLHQPNNVKRAANLVVQLWQMVTEPFCTTLFNVGENVKPKKKYIFYSLKGDLGDLEDLGISMYICIENAGSIQQYSNNFPQRFNPVTPSVVSVFMFMSFPCFVIDVKCISHKQIEYFHFIRSSQVIFDKIRRKINKLLYIIKKCYK